MVGACCWDKGKKQNKEEAEAGSGSGVERARAKVGGLVVFVVWCSS
jgi:hypothetical protein